MQNRVPIFVIIIVAAAGIGLSSYMVRRVSDEVRFEAEAQRLDGEVVAFEEHHDTDNGPTYAPVFRFATTDGQSLDRPSREASRPAVWSNGERARIMFDPREPTYVVADTWRERWGISALIGVVALSLFASAGLSIRARLVEAA